jgi:hypothetical protein
MLQRTAQLVHRAAVSRSLARGARGITSEIAKASSRILADDQTRRDFIDSALRVDHAGEYGAVRIYEGQVLRLAFPSSASLLYGLCDHLRLESNCLPCSSFWRLAAVFQSKAVCLLVLLVASAWGFVGQSFIYALVACVQLAVLGSTDVAPIIEVRLLCRCPTTQCVCRLCMCLLSCSLLGGCVLKVLGRFRVHGAGHEANRGSTPCENERAAG